MHSDRKERAMHLRFPNGRLRDSAAMPEIVRVPRLPQREHESTRSLLFVGSTFRFALALLLPFAAATALCRTTATSILLLLYVRRCYLGRERELSFHGTASSLQTCCFSPQLPLNSDATGHHDTSAVVGRLSFSAPRYKRTPLAPLFVH